MLKMEAHIVTDTIQEGRLFSFAVNEALYSRRD
jgi:hypothetical protein